MNVTQPARLSAGEENVFLFVSQLSLRVTATFVELGLDTRSCDRLKASSYISITFSQRIILLVRHTPHVQYHAPKLASISVLYQRQI